MIDRLDLNLFPILEAVIREGNVTRAARKLGLSQPTVSRALIHLRAQLGDELMIRTRGGMEPTPRARLLLGPLSRALDDVRRAIALEAGFEPHETRATFTVSMNDYECMMLLPALHARLSKEAPHARLSVHEFRRPVVEEALTTGAVQLAIARIANPKPHLYQCDLFTESFVLAMRRGHPLDHSRPTMAQIVSVPHIMISPGGTGDMRGLFDSAIEAVGHSRRVMLSVPHFLAAQHVLASSDAVMVSPRRLARRYAELLPISIRPLPVPTNGFVVSMTWHLRVAADPAQRWFRQLVSEIASADCGSVD